MGEETGADRQDETDDRNLRRHPLDAVADLRIDGNLGNHLRASAQRRLVDHRLDDSDRTGPLPGAVMRQRTSEIPPTLRHRTVESLPGAAGRQHHAAVSTAVHPRPALSFTPPLTEAARKGPAP